MIEHEYFECSTGKRGYESPYIADRVRKSLKKKPGRNETTIRSYKCKSCGYWHNTSKPFDPTVAQHLRSLRN